MRYDLSILNSYIDEGWIVKQDHPTLPLSIYNYSRTCQYEKKWDDITLNCRGLILDKEGNVIASSFAKFFNYEELLRPNQIPEKGDYVYVQEKVDGSLGTLFYYNNEWHLATKGSFISEQAIKGMEIIKSKYNLRAFETNTAYICEIIYPENRIVVDYSGEEKVVFLSATINGEEVHWTTAKAIFNMSGIPEEDLVKTEQHFAFGPDLYRSLKAKNEANKEGFILRFQPGNFRMKIKFEEYVRLHSLLTNFATTDIWEALKEGRSEDIIKLLQQVPDEFDKWVRYKIGEFKYAFYSIYERCGKAHDSFKYGKYGDKDPEPSKKDYALYVQNNMPPELHPVMYAMWSGNRVKQTELIWKLLKPKYQKPFWNKEENS